MRPASVSEMVSSSSSPEDESLDDEADALSVVSSGDDIDARKVLLKRTAVSGWFLGAECSDIRQENVVQWYAWAFFLKKPMELT